MRYLAERHGESGGESHGHRIGSFLPSRHSHNVKRRGPEGGSQVSHGVWLTHDPACRGGDIHGGVAPNAARVDGRAEQELEHAARKAQLLPHVTGGLAVFDQQPAATQGAIRPESQSLRVPVLKPRCQGGEQLDRGVAAVCLVAQIGIDALIGPVKLGRDDRDEDLPVELCQAETSRQRVERE